MIHAEVPARSQPLASAFLMGDSCPEDPNAAATFYAPVIRFCFLLAILVRAAAIPTASTLAAELTSPAAPQTGSPILDDAPQPLTPERPVTESDSDRNEALALFSAGRMHENREQYAEALRCYQRALRCDPKSSTIIRAIISAALRLRHYQEAVRYALKAAELDDPDPVLLRRLGGHLSEQGDWARALTLYEKALDMRGQDKPTSADVLLDMEMGRLYQLTGKHDKAADCFARVLYAIDHPEEFALDQDFAKVALGREGPAYQLIGECFLAAGKPQEALDAFQKADRVAPDKPLLLYNRARVYLKTEKPAEALADLESAFAERLGGEGLTPYETLAEALAALGRKDELLGRLEKLRADEPDNVPLRYFLAAQYREAGQLDKAESLYVELLNERPNLTGYRSLVEMHRQNKQFDKLLGVLGEALDKTSVLDLLGAESQTISGDPDAMQGIVDAARNRMKNEPDRFTYGMRLAVALLALEAKHYETAAEFFGHAIDADPKKSAEVLMVWGVGLLLGERAAEAAEVFQRGIDSKTLPDDNPAFHFYLAGALAMNGRIDEALAAARIAAEKKKDSARYRSREAWVLYVAKRYDEAQKAYAKLVEEFDSDRTSDETREVLREARLALSNLGVIQGDPAQAQEWLEQILDEFPDDVGAMNDLGYFWADQNKHLQRAYRMIQKAVAAEPENKAYRDSLGWVLFRLGKYPEALVELEKASAGDKPDGVVLDHLGDVYQKLNQRDKAEAAWRKAAEAFRQEKEMEKAKAVEKKIVGSG